MKANNTTIENALHLAFSPEYINALSLVELAETWSDNHNAHDLELNIAAYSEQCTYKMEQEGVTLEFDAWERLTAEIERIARVWVSLYCNEISWSNRPEWIANSVRAALNTTTTPETPNPVNTPATMNANETISAAIIAELNTRKDRSAWDKGVTEYATELAESLDNWDKQPESVAELREMMLNGADDWKAYSWGGSSLIYNQDIAERLCSPSELKRVTNKNGLRDYPNSREHWLDVQARALYQAANRVAEIASKLFNA